jgi:hypothetical protein
VYTDSEEILTLAEYAEKAKRKLDTVRRQAKAGNLQAPWAARSKADGHFEIYRRLDTFEIPGVKDNPNKAIAKLLREGADATNKVVDYLEEQERGVAESACTRFLFDGLEDPWKIVSLLSAVAVYNKPISIKIDVDSAGHWRLAECSEPDLFFRCAPEPLKGLLLRWRAHIKEWRERRTLSLDHPPYPGLSTESIWATGWAVMSCICLNCGRETDKRPCCPERCLDNYRNLISDHSKDGPEELDSWLLKRMNKVTGQALTTWRKLTENLGND